MSQKFQGWLLNNTTSLQHLVNERLAKRGGAIGGLFKRLEIGPREYSAHTLHRIFRMANFFWVRMFQVMGAMRPVGSRFFGLSNGPLNYPALMVYCFTTAFIFARCRFSKSREQYTFNAQDGVEFWFDRYNMMFPPSFLHNRLSAHYIEINNIFFTEMLRRYLTVRKEILAERDLCSQAEHHTKHITNPNYIYEPFNGDTDEIKRLRLQGSF